METKRTYTEPAREIPIRDNVDILVVGGGPSGIMAARAAAGKGLKVMLIESRGYVGGNLTLGSADPRISRPERQSSHRRPASDAHQQTQSQGQGF